MTARATDRLAVRGRTMIDCFGNRFVTVPARMLGYLVIAWRDAKRIGKVSGREIEGMPEAVPRFGHVLADQIVRRMAIVANRDRAMARLRPRRIMFTHDVAIRARRRVVRHIRRTARIHERKCTNADGHPQQHHGNRQQPASHAESFLSSM